MVWSISLVGVRTPIKRAREREKRRLIVICAYGESKKLGLIDVLV